jgi:hypothetical protein
MLKLHRETDDIRLPTRNRFGEAFDVLGTVECGDSDAMTAPRGDCGQHSDTKVLLEVRTNENDFHGHPSNSITQ